MDQNHARSHVARLVFAYRSCLLASIQTSTFGDAMQSRSVTSVVDDLRDRFRTGQLNRLGDLAIGQHDRRRGQVASHKEQ